MAGATVPTRRRNPLRHLVQRYTTSATDLQRQSLREESEQAGATCLADAPMRTPVRLHGTITMVTINPRGVNRWLEAVVDDGTGEVTLIWMGRRVVRGIEPGRRLEVVGPITLFEGRRAIYNPNYSLLA